MWMNLKAIILNESNQTQKATYCMIPLTGNVQKRQIHSNMWISGCQGLGGSGVYW
jgi:hypothetical protein